MSLYEAIEQVKCELVKHLLVGLTRDGYFKEASRLMFHLEDIERCLKQDTLFDVMNAIRKVNYMLERYAFPDKPLADSLSLDLPTTVTTTGNKKAFPRTTDDL